MFVQYGITIQQILNNIYTFSGDLGCIPFAEYKCKYSNKGTKCRRVHIYLRWLLLATSFIIKLFYNKNARINFNRICNHHFNWIVILHRNGKFSTALLNWKKNLHIDNIIQSRTEQSRPWYFDAIYNLPESFREMWKKAGSYLRRISVQHLFLSNRDNKGYCLFS